MVYVKVCGITNPEDARTALRSGADAVGLVFAESPRKLNVEQAREIAAALPDNVLKVGVFVDERARGGVADRPRGRARLRAVAR